RKAAARRAIRGARREQAATGGADARAADAAGLARHGMAWLAEHERQVGSRVRCVTAYEEMTTEPPIASFVQALLNRGVQVLVPITMADGVLGWRPAEPGRHDNPMTAQPEQISAGHNPTAAGHNPVAAQRVGDPPADTDTPAQSRGDEALADVDVAFIPALALGPDGTRLGQGGGYYDRTIPALRAMRPEVPVLAVVYPAEVGRDVPALDHDIRVNAVLTPGGVEHLTEGGADHTFEADT
ncbi:MAG: 5-formyltetrahydrofolate cyclo-ligase, partial [Ornithinimicrobium sp.]